MRCRLPLLLSLGAGALLLAFAAGRASKTQAPGTALVPGYALTSAVPGSGERPHAATLQGRYAASVLSASELAAAEESPSHVNEDPWIDGLPPGMSDAPLPSAPSTPPPNLSPAPRALKRIQVQRALVGTDGGISPTQTILEEAAGDDTDLVVYELCELIPRGSGGGAALRGHYGREALNDSDRLWWIELTSAIVKAVGTTRWPMESTLLAWSEDPSLLFVRQDRAALRIIESVLDGIDARQIEAYPVRVEMTKGHSELEGLKLEVDVPGQVPVRAWEGRAWTYHYDHEIEISMGAFLSDPLWNVVEVGLGVAAVRRPIEGTTPDDIELEVLLCTDAPRFETLEVSTLEFGRVTIEGPQIELLSWRGRLPAVAGAHTSGSLGPDCQFEIAVGEPTGPNDPAQRSWRRRALPANPTPPSSWASALVFELTASLSGRLGQGKLDLSDSKRRARVSLRPYSPAWPPEEPRDGPLRPSGADYRVACGEISLELVALDSAQDPGRLDLCLSVSEWTGDARLVEIQWGEGEPMGRRLQVSLPSAHTVVVSRRVFLSTTGEGLLKFEADLGQGRESFTLAIGKFSARSYR